MNDNYVMNNSVGGKNRLLTIATSVQIATVPFMTILINGRGVLLYSAIFYGLILMISVFFKKVNFNFTKRFFILSCFFLFEFFSLLWAIDSREAWINYSQYVKVVLLILLMSNVIYNEGEKKIIILTQTLTALYIGIYMLIQQETLFTSGRLILVLDGVFQDPNYLCSLFILPILYCISEIIKGKSIQKMTISFFIVALFLYVIIETGSRGGLLAVTISSLIFLLKENNCTFRHLFTSSLIILIVLITIPLILENLPLDMIERMLQGFTMKDEGSGRIEIWKAIITNSDNNLFRFFFGYGKGTVVSLYGISAHNLILESFVETGLIGVSILCGYFLSLYKKVWNSHNSLATAYYIGTLLMGLTLSVNSDKYFWMNIIIVNILINKKSNKQQSSQCKNKFTNITN